jgi:hypothetical protein
MGESCPLVRALNGPPGEGNCSYVFVLRVCGWDGTHRNVLAHKNGGQPEGREQKEKKMVGGARNTSVVDNYTQHAVTTS